MKKGSATSRPFYHRNGKIYRLLGIAQAKGFFLPLVYSKAGPLAFFCYKKVIPIPFHVFLSITHLKVS